MKPSAKYFYTVTKAAKLLGVSPNTLRNWGEKGKLIPQRTKGGARRYRLSQLTSFLNHQTHALNLVNPASEENNQLSVLGSQFSDNSQSVLSPSVSETDKLVLSETEGLTTGKLDSENLPAGPLRQSFSEASRQDRKLKTDNHFFLHTLPYLVLSYISNSRVSLYLNHPYLQRYPFAPRSLGEVGLYLPYPIYLPLSNYQLPTTIYQPPTTNHEPPSPCFHLL